MNEWLISTIKIIIYSDYKSDYKLHLLEKITEAYNILKEVENELEDC
jgi:hypothetical protein